MEEGTLNYHVHSLNFTFQQKYEIYLFAKEMNKEFYSISYQERIQMN